MKIMVGLLPGIILSCIFLLNDKDLHYRKVINIIMLLILGAIGSYICYRFEMHYGSYFKKVVDSNYFEVLFYAIFGVAIFEEGYKWVLTSITSFLTKIKHSYDIVTYSIFSSIGFLTFENVVYYVIPYGMSTALRRIFTSIPSHICFAIIMGYFLEKGLNSSGMKRYLYYLLGFIIPTFIHAYYNSFLYKGKFSEYFLFNFIIIIIISILLFVSMQIKRKNKRSQVM